MKLQNEKGGMDIWHRLQILITQEQETWLQAESYTTQRSKADIVRAAIEHYRRTKKKP